jgi:CRP/FNR family cyclic AMP-dependent transcriptional regulator
LSKFDWIEGLEEGLRTELLAHSTETCVPKDTIIQHGGEVATHIFQVVRGRIRQFVLDENGNEILLHVYQPGDILGDSLGLGKMTYPLWLSTEGTVTLRTWPVKLFGDFKARHPAINAAVDIQTAQRFRIAIVLLTEFATLDAQGRVAGRLVHLCHFAALRGAVYLDSSQEDLGMMANVSRQTVNKVVAELAGTDIVRGGYGSILVKDMEGLKRYRDSHRRRA